MLTGFASVIVNNIATICIGKYYKSSQLGYYTRASQFSEMIAWTISDVLGSVTFPVLSKLQDDTQQLVNVYRRSLFYTALIVFPIMILCALLAKPLVVMLLTEKWMPAVFLLQILCLARMFSPLSAINLNLLNAIGRSDLFMKVDFSKFPLILVTLAITIPLGVDAIVIGSLVNTFICFFVNAYYPGKLYGYGALEQIKDFKKIFFAIIPMIFVVLLVEYLFDNNFVVLFLGSLIGIATYVSVCLLLKVVTVQELKNIRS
jgi:O-antigen/teichoic acid export membrane protein